MIQRNKLIEVYKGYDICMVNSDQVRNRRIGIKIDNSFSIIALSSIQAAKNVIDTFIKNKKR